MFKEQYVSFKEKLVQYNYIPLIQSIFEKCRWFNIQITTAFGITTTIHWSVILFLLIMLFVDPLQAGVMVIAYLSIIPHEYGHALAARWYGIQTNCILLYPIGGVAFLIPNNIKLEKVRELVVAAAGPVVSLVLALFGLTMGCFCHGKINNIDNFTFWDWLFYVNIVLFIFNVCICCFPMDGGRILRASLNLFMSHLNATWWSVRIGQFIAVFIIICGLLTHNILLVMTLIIIAMLSEKELQHAIQINKN